MTRDEFVQHLLAGKPATLAVREITGCDPEIVTIAELEDIRYLRYGVMMAGELMAGIVILELDIWEIPENLMDRIRLGEPAGIVLEEMERRGDVKVIHQSAVQSEAELIYHGTHVGRAQEIFTESLFM